MVKPQPLDLSAPFAMRDLPVPDALDALLEMAEFVRRLRTSGWTVNLAIETTNNGPDLFTLSGKIGGMQP